MTLLITGGAGFIGSALVRAALSRGRDVVTVDALTYAGTRDNLTDLPGRGTHTFCHVDIRDAAALDRVFDRHRPTAVVHLAAESHVDRSIDGPLSFVDTNVAGTATLLQAARGYWEAAGRPDGFRFVHVSTDEVFGTLGTEGLFDEDTPYAPSSPYSASKAASDHLVRAWHRTYGLPVLITNCSNNYGPRQHPEKLIPVTILAALEERPIPVYGRGENVRDWLFVEDHVDALLAVLECGRVGRTYAVGGDNEWRNVDLVRHLCALLDARRPRPGGGTYGDLVTFVTDRPGHDERYGIDAARIRSELGWRPATPMDAGLAATVDWYLDHRDWCRRRMDAREAAQ
ncbi:dTDP-glucose 4,6-dehydratase [Rhodobacteraceae bacterium CCMM004]|nr:dTDP-glucose 4,6-dehydratase [Rhodobacteraceae bacterium CCMM004]